MLRQSARPQWPGSLPKDACVPHRLAGGGKQADCDLEWGWGGDGHQYTITMAWGILVGGIGAEAWPPTVIGALFAVLLTTLYIREERIER